MTISGPDAAELLDFSAADAAPRQSRRWRVLLWGAVVVAVFALAAVLVPKLTIDAKRSQLTDQIAERLQIAARGQAEVVSTWLQGTQRLADPLVESELIRLFAAEMDLADGDMARLAAPQSEEERGLGVPLVDQLPFIERVITDFAANADFLAAYLVGRKGDTFATSDGAASYTALQRALAKQAVERGQTVFGPARGLPAGMAMDLAIPVFAAQVEPGTAPPVAVLVLVTPLAGSLAEILAVNLQASPGVRRTLLQLDGGALFRIAPGSAEAIREVSLDGFDLAAGEVPFARRPSLSGPDQVYSTGAMVSGPTWWIVEELEVGVAERPLETYATAAIVVAALVVIAVAVAFGAFWWRLSSLHNEALARQYQSLAGRIQAQKQLLDSINGAISEHIGLKDAEGTYVYANPAFAAAVGRDPDAIAGLDDAAIFGRGTANRLALSDRRVLKNQEAVTVDEEIYFDSSLRHLQISKAPFLDSDGTSRGIVSVTRDITELVEQRRKKERAIEQMVAALVRAIELRDPYLAGHSRRVAEFAVAVGRQMDCADDLLTTVELAANLSQIGKLAVPEAILTKPARLTEDEIRQMETHVEHAVHLLEGIEFELPVVETIAQMHERLDGKGYPKGLEGNAITLAARILGACDVFCARVEPRSYRASLAPDAVLDILQENSSRYDPKVIEALRQVATTISGEKLIAGIAAG